MTLDKLFRSDNNYPRDAFLARLFGIFNEKIVHIWGRDARSPYKNLGRPTMSRDSKSKPYSVLDFTFESEDERIYVAEMKCEMMWENYKYLTLESPEQIDHHIGKPAFDVFLDAARNPKHYMVRVGGKPLPHFNGSILVWGRYTDEGREMAIDKYGFADVLSVENIIKDLLNWENREYPDLLAKYESWCNELFVGLRNIKD